LDGIERPVRIVRDTWGIAHIYAETEADLFFAQGYQAAHDRLFQFEIWRRRATGTLAEILGPRAVDHDIGARLFAYRGDLEMELNHYHSRGGAIIRSFVAGVNAYIDLVRRDSSLLPEEFRFALLSLQRRVDAYVIEEYANLSRRDSPTLLFDLMGFGRPLDSYSPNRASYLLGEFGPALGGIAEAAGRPVDDWTCHGEVAATRVDTTILAGELAEGTVGAQRNILSGHSQGAEVVRFTATWYCTTELEPAWDLRPTGWRVQVRGDAPLDVELPFPAPVDELADFTPAYTANRPVNAIPYVCAARPGFLATEDLPPIVPAGPREGGAP
jgi:4-hydroxy-tetrahydrodipicolinate reductase